jgi:hypothetical protein
MDTLKPALGAVRTRAAVVGAALLLMAALAATTAPVAHAANENFCEGTLQPYGHSGDRCWGTTQLIYDVNLVTYERSGCVDVANGNNELLQSWTCISSANSTSLLMEPSIRRKGVVRNNNLTYTGRFAAGEAW